MLARQQWLRRRSWRLVILDEAQAIKNSGTRQARAARELRAAGRIALTGTPVENRLSDLWSLFDFLNPGLLGNAKAFASFVKKMEAAPRPSYQPLRALVGPHILRRLKTDKRVIAELPDKTERAEPSPTRSGARPGATTWSRTATSRTACRAAAPTSATARSWTCKSSRARSPRWSAARSYTRSRSTSRHCRTGSGAAPSRAFPPRPRQGLIPNTKHQTLNTAAPSRAFPPRPRPPQSQPARPPARRSPGSPARSRKPDPPAQLRRSSGPSSVRRWP